MSKQPFRFCGACGEEWRDWQEFVRDDGLRLLGLQAHASAPDHNVIVFEHRCGSTVSVLARRLRHLLPDPTRWANLPNLYGTEECRDHCRTLEDLEECDRPCVNAGDRRLIQILIAMQTGDR